MGISGFLGNLGILWELSWDFYKITVDNADANIQRTYELFSFSTKL